MTSTNHPKAGFNLPPSMRFDNKVPINIPAIAIAEIFKRKV